MHKHACLLIAGGLAAPALAAVAGSVATTIGGSAAAATAVTGMMGSSVGAASMIAGFGYYGGRVTADHMARRIGTFIHSIPLSLLPSFMHAYMHAFAQSLNHTCMLSLSHSIIHAFLQAHLRSLVHLFINALLHRHICSLSPPPFLMHACNQGGFFLLCGWSLSHTHILVGLQGLVT